MRRYGKIIRAVGERHFFDQRSRLLIVDVDRVCWFDGDIDPRTIRREGNPMGPFDVLDFLYNLVRHRINDVDGYAGGIGHIDERGLRAGRNRRER
jgi:hypothetical protein